MNKNESTTGANVVGFQGHSNKKAIEKLLKYGKVKEDYIKLFIESSSEQTFNEFHRLASNHSVIEAIEYALDSVQEAVLRKFVKNYIKEIVRKKPGGGGYTLYSPNKGKKHQSKAVGDFPTKVQAKRAELQRFPPKDTQKLQRLRKSIEKLQKNQSKTKNESIETLKKHLVVAITEGFFTEDKESSVWDERITKLSKAAVESDKRFQKLQKDIEKKRELVLSDSLKAITKALKSSGIKVSSGEIKKDLDKKETYLHFSLSIDGVTVGPLFVRIVNDVPRIEISNEAKNSFTKLEPEKAKLVRGELITIEESFYDDEQIVSAIKARDSYLTKTEMKIDGFVSDLTALEISVLKNLLVQKYRGK